MTKQEHGECSHCQKREVDNEVIEVLIAISVVAKQLARKLTAIAEKGEPKNEPNE